MLRPMMKNVVLACLLVMSLGLLNGCIAEKFISPIINPGVSESEPETRTERWQDFLNSRPSNDYVVIKGEPELTHLCKDVTNFYRHSSGILNKFVIRVENCKVAKKLDYIYTTEGREAYEVALGKLSKSDRKEYRKYVNNEINQLAAVLKFADNAIKLRKDFFKVYKRFTRISPNLEEMARLAEIALILDGLPMDQLNYTVQSWAWLNEYNNLLVFAEQNTRR